MIYSSVSVSDVESDESLRQSELVNRLVARVIEDDTECSIVQSSAASKRLERSIMAWLLDNNLVITRDSRRQPF